MHATRTASPPPSKIAGADNRYNPLADKGFSPAFADSLTVITDAGRSCCHGLEAIRTTHLIDLGGDGRTGWTRICDVCCRVLAWSLDSAPICA